MNGVREGGDAFPSPGVLIDWSNKSLQQQGAYAGMSLRDYFAARAMQSLLGATGGPFTDIDAENIAAYSYWVADLMLAARHPEDTLTDALRTQQEQDRTEKAELLKALKDLVNLCGASHPRSGFHGDAYNRARELLEKADPVHAAYRDARDEP